MTRNVCTCAFLLVFLATVSTPAFADQVLSISAGGTNIVIADGSALDSNPDSGAITYIGSVGGFSLNVVTGLTKPVIGSATFPQMDVSSVHVSSDAAGSITILHTDTDFGLFGPGGVPMLARAGWTTVGSVDYRAFSDPSNAEFGMATMDARIAGVGAFGDTKSYTLCPLGCGGPISLTQRITINHPGGAGMNSSGNFEIRTVPVPEPASVALLGIGLTLLGITSIVRERRQIAVRRGGR